MPPLKEFRVEFDNPRRSYFPGQNVTGRVIVATLNDENTHGLKIKLEGRARVHFSSRGGLRGHDVNSKQAFGRNYDAYDHLVDLTMYAFGDGESTINIPPGQYVYPFNFQLPQMLPSSFVGEYGKVCYEVGATIQRPKHKFDHETRESITVNAIVDLNANPSLAVSCEHRKEKHFYCLCCASGPLGFLIQLPTQGYTPGQHVTPVVEIYNHSYRTVNKISLELYQNATYFADCQMELSSKVVASTSRSGIGPRCTDTWQGNILQIPSVSPSTLDTCKIIDVAYNLFFEAHVSGTCFQNLTTSVPITIGTIPFGNEGSAGYAEMG